MNIFFRLTLNIRNVKLDVPEETQTVFLLLKKSEKYGFDRFLIFIYIKIWSVNITYSYFFLLINETISQ